jgi:hypothetical protein
MKQMLYWIVGMLGILYLGVAALVYFGQEKIIFYPQKLPPDYAFRFGRPFRELVIPAADGTPLHGLLFPVPAPRGLVFYLHGNAGSLGGWGEIAGTYTDLGYDVFLLDYRGFGKSGGRIGGEKQFYADAQAAYHRLREGYAEQNIVVIGYSIGTAVAARLAATNRPRRLILQAPYYSLPDLARRLFPVLSRVLPGVLIKYKFNTWQFVRDAQVPVTVFHGDRDEVIPYEAALQLKKYLKPADQFVTLPRQGHNGMNENPDYQAALERLLQ